MKCRACMKANCNNLVDMSVAGADGGQTLFDYYNDCTQLRATASDSFPKKLCKTCTKKLRIAYSFRKCALESNDMFEKFLTLQKINTQSPANLIVDTEDYSNDPLEIELCESRKAVKQTDSESPMKEEGWNQPINDYSCDSALINETVIIEQSQVSSCSNNNPSQADKKEDWYEEHCYDENTCPDIETYETGTETKEDSSSLNVGETDHLEIEIDTTRLQCLYCKQIYSSDLELQHHVKNIYLNVTSARRFGLM
ncbi:uncharacterized protein LOC126759778 [Bactrocera neohumeralis]|uniref:uncharacterized protein LOC126759778 n=1 Tax=Bactrocera neohumeralis TaxID=98809 RepID=UPI0021662B39|nr:uncharacterized protein LOC126759778 [Bactrocera neohumeralis]